MHGPPISSISSILASVFLTVSLVGTSDVAAAAERMCRNLFKTQKVVAENRSNSKNSNSATDAALSHRVRKTYVELDGQSIYYEAITAAPGKPTALVFLGLFTPMSDLQKFQMSFLKQSRGEGLIVFSYSTATESLIFGAVRKSERYAQTAATDLTDYARQATAVINAEGVRGPLTVVGYSYGSAPAARFASFHRERVGDLIFASPLVYPGEHSPQMIVGKEIAESLAAMNPFFGSKMIDGLRARAAEDTASKIVEDFLKRGRFPDFLPAEVVVQSLTAQIRATEEFDLRKEDFALWPRTHFLLAGKEAPSRLSAQQDVIRAVRNFNLGHVESVEGGAHAIMADQPSHSAKMILRILRNEPATTNIERR